MYIEEAHRGKEAYGGREAHREGSISLPPPPERIFIISIKNAGH
jgi:hypothetical protein